MRVEQRQHSWEFREKIYTRKYYVVIDTVLSSVGRPTETIVDGASVDFVRYCSTKKGNYPNYLQEMIDYEKRDRTEIS